MAEIAAPSWRTEPASQGRVARARQWLHRAVNLNGHERHTLTLIGKSTFVASIAWFIAHDVMHAPTPAFAPFSAVLIMQITAYQSVLQSLRYVGAVSVGVGLQGVFGAVAGPNMLTFVLVALVAVGIGRWGRLGSQGSQVATAAFFAFSTYEASAGERQGLIELGQIVLLVVIGCGVGVLVNVLVLPPMRYRSAEHGIHALGQSLCDLAGSMYPALREGELDKERTGHWRHRATYLGPMVTQAQSSVRTAWESIYYHPRRLLQRQRHDHRTTFSGYQSLVDALERVTHQVASMTRSFDQWQDGHGSAEHRSFLRRYGDFLACFAGTAQVLSRLDEDRLPEQVPELRAAAERGQDARTRLAEEADAGSLPVGDPSEPYGILLAEAVRLMEEVQYTCDVLEQATGQPEADRRCGAGRSGGREEADRAGREQPDPWAGDAGGREQARVPRCR